MHSTKGEIDAAFDKNTWYIIGEYTQAQQEWMKARENYGMFSAEETAAFLSLNLWHNQLARRYRSELRRQGISTKRTNVLNGTG